MKKRKLLGYCAVDSGQLLIVDPCYLNEWKDGEFDASADSTDIKRNHYHEACVRTLDDKMSSEMVISGIAGTGVVSGTFDGDGSYPVYAEYNEKGELRALTVELQ